MRLILLIAAAFIFTSPALSRSTMTAQPPSAERLDTDLASYGRFLGEIARIQQPVQQQLSRLQGEWRAATQQGDPRIASERFRPVIARALAVIAEANSAFRSLQAPDLAPLDLPEDIRPAELVRQMIRTNEQAANVIEGYQPLLDAMIRNDAAAAGVAANGLISGVRLLLESQILLTRAAMATTPREESSWEMQNVELVFYRSAVRTLSAWPRSGGSPTDPTLASDLRAMADELERTAEEGTAKLEREMADFSAQIPELERGNDAASASILRRTMAALSVDREIFVVARDLAAVLRRGADSIGPTISLADLTRLFSHAQTFRARFDDIIRREAAAVAELAPSN
ncbi:hypothetical protein [Sphingosinicella sp.]|uniref:hypothetical protein n=1 Tax=Sphingosinicella sp. TaxID=1917971 RepID=UPI00403813D9